jgi:hypothetical protein
MQQSNLNGAHTDHAMWDHSGVHAHSPSPAMHSQTRFKCAPWRTIPWSSYQYNFFITDFSFANYKSFRRNKPTKHINLLHATKRTNKMEEKQYTKLRRKPKKNIEISNYTNIQTKASMIQSKRANTSKILQTQWFRMNLYKE